MNVSPASANITSVATGSSERSINVTSSAENPQTNHDELDLTREWNQNCASRSNGLMTQAQAAFCNYIETEMNNDSGSVQGVIFTALVAVGVGLLAGAVVNGVRNYFRRPE